MLQVTPCNVGVTEIPRPPIFTRNKSILPSGAPDQN